MAQQRYDVGDSIRVFVQFLNLEGQKENPTLVRAAVKTPAGMTTEADATEDTQDDPDTGLPYVGRYYIDVLPSEGSNDQPYWVRFEGTGAVVAAEEQELWVRPQQVVIPA